MAKYPESHQRIIRGGSGCWKLANPLWSFGVLFTALGVVAAAAQITLSLGAAPWFLVAVVAFVASLAHYLIWAVGVYLEAVEAGSEKEK